MTTAHFPENNPLRNTVETLILSYCYSNNQSRSRMQCKRMHQSSIRILKAMPKAEWCQSQRCKALASIHAGSAHFGNPINTVQEPSAWPAFASFLAIDIYHRSSQRKSWMKEWLVSITDSREKVATAVATVAVGWDAAPALPAVMATSSEQARERVRWVIDHQQQIWKSSSNREREWAHYAEQWQSIWEIISTYFHR